MPKPNELGLAEPHPVSGYEYDILGSIDVEDLLRIIKAPNRQPVSIERLGNNRPQQLTVVAHLISEETTKAKNFSTIEMRPL